MIRHVIGNCWYCMANWIGWLLTGTCMGPRQPPHRPNPQECGGSTFLSQEGPAQRQAGVLSCTGSNFTLALKFHKSTWMRLLCIILTDTRARIFQPYRLASPLRVRKLHFPPLGKAGARAGRHAAVHRFNLIVPLGIFEHILLQNNGLYKNMDHHMNMYPPTPTPDPSLESAEAPLSSLGRGRRRGVPAHNPCNGSDR